MGDTSMILIDRVHPMYFDDEESGKKYLREHGIPEEAIAEVIFLHSIGTCFRCGSPLFPSQTEGYTCQCFNCDEDFFSFEQMIDKVKRELSVITQVPRDVLFGETL